MAINWSLLNWIWGPQEWAKSDRPFPNTASLLFSCLVLNLEEPVTVPQLFEPLELGRAPRKSWWRKGVYVVHEWQRQSHTRWSLLREQQHATQPAASCYSKMASKDKLTLLSLWQWNGCAQCLCPWQVSDPCFYWLMDGCQWANSIIRLMAMG